MYRCLQNSNYSKIKAICPFFKLFFASKTMDLIQLDQQLFTYINQVWTNSAADMLLPLFRNKIFWIPLYFFLAAWLLLNFRRKGLWVILCLAATVIVGDFVSSGIIKPLVQRDRPCNDTSLTVRNLVRCGPGKSFTSSHATNHFAIAVFLSVLLGYRQRWVWVLGLAWAGAISYAQVYVGVHFPLDVFCGALLGSLIGFGGANFARRFVDLSELRF
jgi:membrane-associated phospholipid phosphatase